MPSRWSQQREEAAAQRHAINLQYLNPLRLWLEETYVRLQLIETELALSDRPSPLLSVPAPAAISQQDAIWFNQAGAYLASTCYITACLFWALKQVREHLPYLRLSREGDTELMTLMFQVSQAFLQDLGIFYVIQPSLGNDVYLASQQRLMTYREFCERLQQPEERVWSDRLIQFYLDIGQRRRPQNLAAALQAIRTLSAFLDEQIGAGVSIRDRLNAEGITS
ncbi:hypothetical protein [Leptolyngbya iicbica]|uniref:Uncharacterized protein n=2 Tax=Cyanophyceae TaxID=3028117 RepID=A0A4Q7E8Z7_9CYAN|nr:hypothetical protein [Leptolyngbya sp. LK]RZM79038.1 hypothetical protein DYY88_09725 [Leptolyngbya sp. LK]